MNQATKEFVKQWLERANEDLLVVERLTKPEIAAISSVCFHCQQATEKFLKAFLVANEVKIKKTHNIEFLLSECEEIDHEFSEIDSKNLSDFGVDVRYPGDIYIPTESETKEYIEIAYTIKNLVEIKLQDKLRD